MSNREKTPALKIEQLSVNYDKTPVLWDIHCTIPEGKLVGIIGPNGAGKSTLLKTLLGMTRPLSGRIEFFGRPLQKSTPSRRLCSSAQLRRLGFSDHSL